MVSPSFLFPTNINRTIKLRTIRWAGHVEHTVNKVAYNILITKPNEKRLPETIGVDGRIIKIDIEIR